MFFFGRKKRNVANFIEKNEQINLSKVLSEAEKKENSDDEEKEVENFELLLLRDKKNMQKSVDDLLSSAEKIEICPVSKNIHIKNNSDKVEMQEKVSEFYNKEKGGKKVRRPLTREEKRAIIEKRRYIMTLEKNSYAGFFPRFISFIIDSLIVSSIITFIPAKYVLKYNSLYPAVSLFILVYIIYSLLTNIILKGQSIGKLIMGIKVVKDGTEDIDLFTIIFRETVGKLFMLKLPVLGIFMIFSKKNHHLMDYFIDTSVLRLKYIEDYRVLMTINA